MKRLAFQLTVIMALSAALALANAWFNPNRPPWNPDVLAEGEISVASLENLASVVFLDARKAEDFEKGHIPGARLLNEDDWETLLFAFFDTWNPEDTIVVYCSSSECQASHAVAERLKVELGVTEIYVLKGGWEAWNAHSE